MIERLSEVVGVDVPRETFDRLRSFVSLLTEAARTQNLVAASTIDAIWERHILDCAQLLRFGAGPDCWADVGSGAGLPGLVLAILSPDPITLVEPRRLRVEFLRSAIATLGLTNATVVQGKATSMHAKVGAITARAVASTGDLLAMTSHLSRPDTVWVLPKGKSAQKELDDVRATWQGEFRLEPSLTDADASILIATGVRRRRAR